ncbi:hypothetical protein NAT51_05155 [Flavobacterium amniphilum]|uniref:hypothetical protein n=1 Tax=Flavobacterium amniphilum TaxID=1834035 RepID=UPI00202AA288|nr:hypothetical protein [Flavobacterium amniphilum]MCL9804896.1 hypothetical protein [Flavobacterium amniphilum]
MLRFYIATVNDKLEILAKIGVFGTFLGHGIVAIGVNPKWIPLLTCYGFSEEQAVAIMPLIGIADIIVALTILLYPIRAVVVWAVLWALMAALSRPISGERFVEFVERSANWCLPLLLLLLLGIPNDLKSWFKTKE